MVLLTHSLREARLIEFLLLCSQRVYSVPIITVAVDIVTTVTGNQIKSTTKKQNPNLEFNYGF